jgi:hypothetical protein
MIEKPFLGDHLISPIQAPFAEFSDLNGSNFAVMPNVAGCAQ